MTVAAQTFTGAYDSFGRYRLKVTLDETSVNTAGNSSSGTVVLTLEGAGGYDFNGFTTSGSLVVNGVTIYSWNEVRPSGSWSGSVTLVTGSWTAAHTTNGTKTIAVSASFDARGTPDSYGPGSVISVSGNYTLTNITRLPTAPSGLVVSNLTSTGARLDWGASTSYGTIDEGYGQYLALDEDFTTYAKPATWLGNQRYYVYSNLKRGTEHFFRTRYGDTEGIGPYSGIKSFTTPHEKPDKPVAPSVSGITQTTANINTTDPAYVGAGVTGRETQIRNGTTVVKTYTSSDPAATGLPRNTALNVRFRVENAIGWSDWSDDTDFQTPGAPPSAPTNYNVSEIAATSALVSTGLIADNGGVVPSQIRVKVSTTASDSGLIQTNTMAQWGPLRVTGLTEGTQYYVAEAAYNDAVSGGWGPYGAWVPFTTLTTVPHPPTSLAFGSITNNTATATWAAPADLNGATIESYRLVIATDLAMTANVREIIVPDTSLSQVVDALTAGTQYYGRIYTMTDMGRGSIGGRVAFTTTGGSGTTSGVYIDVAGVPKFAEVWLDVAGVPKKCEVWVDVAGTPKLCVA
jgi:hypothetical protein